jgi:hypothetical protein
MFDRATEARTHAFRFGGLGQAAAGLITVDFTVYVLQSRYVNYAGDYNTVLYELCI